MLLWNYSWSMVWIIVQLIYKITQILIKKEVIVKLGDVYGIYVQNTFNFTTRSDLSINWNAKLVTLEILSEKRFNTIVSVLYKSSNTHFEPFLNFLRTFFLSTKKVWQKYHVVEDFDLNLSDYDISKSDLSEYFYSNDKQTCNCHQDKLNYYRSYSLKLLFRY